MLPVNAPPALTQVAQRFAATSRGIVAFAMRRIFDAHAGFSSRHEDLTFNAVSNDGRVVKVRVTSYTIDGKPASAQARAEVERGWAHPKPGEAFAAPFDARNFAAYSYRAAGAGTIAFASSVPDFGHGGGSFAYDAARNVVACEYQPNAMPPHARSGDIRDRRAEVLPGYWAVTQETQTYKGSVGPFPGTGTVVLRFYGFRRFGDLQSAVASLPR